MLSLLLALCLAPTVLATPLGLPLLAMGGSDPDSTPAPDSSPPVDTPVRSSKLVAAHVIFGNTERYTRATWHTHIEHAVAANFDAFALNIGNDPWQDGKLDDAFAAAATSKHSSNFKFFISLDMNAIPCGSQADADNLQRIKRFFTSKSYQKFKGKPLLSAFSGADCRFGKGSANEGWEALLGDQVYFVPSFFSPPEQFSQFPVMDGGFNWNSGWPQDKRNISFDADEAWIRNLDGRTYMAAVSPWFFTHYASDSSLRKNFIFYMDEWMLSRRWEQLIEHRRSVDIVEVNSWNDWGESHAIGPLLDEETLPGSQAWTIGYDHTGWLDLFAYYIAAFKTGVYPVLETDRIFLWGRLSPASVKTGDSVGLPEHWEWTKDAVWAVFLLTEPAEIELRCGPDVFKTKATTSVFKATIPLTQNGCQAYIRRTGGDQWSRSFQPKGFVFNTQPETYNFNAFVAASSADD